MERVNEKSAVNWTVKLIDSDGVAAVPTTVEWRLRCAETKTILQAWTTLTPTYSYGDDDAVNETSVAIAIASTLNAMQTSTKAEERKALIIASDRGLSTEWNKEIEYTVVRLKARTD